MNHKLLRVRTLFIAALLMGSAAGTAWAQAKTARTVQKPAPERAASDNGAARTNADETFELNITEQRITERDFAASTSVEAGEESAHGLHLRIGVGVGAEQIDVLLRNVHGLVRFHGTLDRVLDLINSRRAPNAGP